MDGEKVLISLAVFVIFSLLSGSVYLVNDVVDREEDRKHSTKSGRPIAAGRLSPSIALSAAVILALLALAGAFFIEPVLGVISLGYLLLITAYSLVLKRVVIVDVLVIAFGFILRVLAGGVAIEVPISEWLFICTFLLALFLALSKRRHELVLLEGRSIRTPKNPLGIFRHPSRSDDRGCYIIHGDGLQPLHTRAPDSDRSEPPTPTTAFHLYLRDIPLSISDTP